METLYQETGRGKYHIQYEAVKIEDAFNVVYTSDQLQEMYGTKNNKFDITSAYFVVSDARIKLSEMLTDALDAFKKNPKLKFFPAGLPERTNFGYYYSTQLRELGLGYTSTKGGGLVPKVKPNYHVPTKALIYGTKQGIAHRLIVQVQRTYQLDMEVKTSSNDYLNNIVVLCKKLGIKKIPPMNLHTYNPSNGQVRDKLEDFLQDWVGHHHSKMNNPKMIKALAKEMRAWWKDAKEVAR